MNTSRKRFVMLLVLAVLVLLGCLLVAQGPPNACANTCLQNYKAAVQACKGDAACQAAARAAARACIAGCNL